MKRFLPVSLSLLAVTFGAAGQTNTIAPEAARVLRDACQFLAQAPHFGLTAEVWREHVDDSGEKLQFTRSVEMQVNRPNNLHVQIHSAYSDREFWYRGKELTILDRKRNVFSSTAMPDNLDTMLDAAHDQFGIDLPLIDLAVSDPYANAVARVQSGRYVGQASAMGYTCHHLAFTQENIDWQVWIQAGPQPYIRKFVITHKQEPGAPEFTGLVRDWDMVNRISESAFVFQPPREAVKVQMLPDHQFNGPANASRSSTVPSPTGR